MVIYTTCLYHGNQQVLQVRAFSPGEIFISIALILLKYNLHRKKFTNAQWTLTNWKHLCNHYPPLSGLRNRTLLTAWRSLSCSLSKNWFADRWLIQNHKDSRFQSQDLSIRLLYNAIFIVTIFISLSSVLYLVGIPIAQIIWINSFYRSTYLAVGVFGWADITVSITKTFFWRTWRRLERK